MSAGLARPRAVLFDWDNTLVDSWETLRVAINAALVAFGQTPWTIAETRQRVRRSLRDSVPELFGEDWQRARDVFYRTFEAEHLKTVTALPGAAALVAALAADLPLGVVSNKHGDLLRREVVHLGWSGHFRSLVGAADAPRDKPDRAPVDKALAALAESGIETPQSQDVWFVGDTALDMQTAHAAGCIPVLFGAGHGEEAALAAYPPLFRVETLDDLGQIWRGLQLHRDRPKSFP
jgi:phosphoglycolate phosphatase